MFFDVFGVSDDKTNPYRFSRLNLTMTLYEKVMKDIYHDTMLMLKLSFKSLISI